MKNILFYFIAVIMGLSLWSCEKDDLANGTGEFEYMVFGHFYGECGGEGCVEIFKIEQHQLFEDSLDSYPGFDQAYAGMFDLLPDAKYQLVKDLVDQFPVELYSEPETVIGMPDAGDWGGLYIEIKHTSDPGRSGFWLLDQHKGNLPDIYEDFADMVNVKIALINQ